MKNLIEYTKHSMTSLQEYIEESLLDDIDDLEIASDKSVNDRILKNRLQIHRMDCCGMRVKDLIGLREIKKHVKTQETTRFEVLSKRKPLSLNINSTMKPSPLECLFVDYILNQEDADLLNIDHTGYMVNYPVICDAIKKLIGGEFTYSVYRSKTTGGTHFYISIEIHDRNNGRYIKLNFQGR